MLRNLPVAVLFTLFLSLPLAAAPGRRVSPSSTKVKPLALEYRLLAHLAETHPGSREALAERAAYLQRFVGKGYSVSAAYPNSGAATRQLKLRQAAYLALTVLPLEEASQVVVDFGRKHRMRIKPKAAAGRNKGRAASIYALLGGVDDLIQSRRSQVKTLRETQRRAPADPAHVAATAAQIRRLEEQLQLLEGLESKIKKITPAVERYAEFARDILRFDKKEVRVDEQAALAAKAAALADRQPEIVEALAVGTQQVRFTVTKDKRQEIESDLKRRIQGEVKRKLGFIEGDLGVLPAVWDPTAALRPTGDFRLAEYVSDDEVFLTLFDCAGYWYRIIAVEYEKTLYVLVPSDPLDKKSKKQ